MSIFHLRKPESSSQELVLLLQEINPIYYSKIALHSHHYMAKSFGINRLHYTEASRKQLTEMDLQEKKAENIFSTSVHSMTDYENLLNHFEYTFLSPVFDSISKPGYQAQSFDLSKKTETKLIALGGINETNCSKAFDMGFDGIALLGSIWQNDNGINNFKKISQICANESAEFRR